MDKSALSEIERLFKDHKDEQEFVNLVLDLESDSENISKDLMTLLIDVISDCYGLDSLVAAEEEKAAQRQRREIIAQKKGRTGDGYLGDDDDSGGQGTAPKPPVDEAERKKKAGGTMDFLKVFFALLQLCEPATRIELVGRLNDKIKSSGLRAEMELDKRKGTQTLLDTLQHTSKSYSNMLIKEILKLLSTMIGYSIRIHEVKKILMFLMGTSNPMLIKEKPFYFNNLLEVLRVASTTPREGPRSFFSLSGIGSGLRLPTFSLPNGGFTFIIWVRLEHLGNTYIASFSTRAGDGVYLYLHNKQLCLKYRVGKDDAIKLQDCDIKPREWHMIAITHTYKVVLKSELTVNINGRLTFTQGVTYPKFEEPFFASYIGNNDAVIHKDGFGWSPVCGQVGDFMLVEGSLDAQEIRAIYRSRTLGQNGCMLVLPKRSARLAFSYTSKAVKGTFCVDTSALTDASRWASLLGDTSVSNRFPLNEALLNAGGIKLLLPLFRQIGLPAQPPPAAAATLTSSDESDENEEGETEDKEAKKSADEANGLLASNSQALCDLISFISNIVAIDQRFLHGIYSCDFFSLLGYALGNNNFRHELWTKSAVDELFGLITVTGRHDQIRRRALEEILFNFSIWAHTPMEIQAMVVAHITEKIKAEPLYFRERLGVQGVLDIARTYYWFTKEAEYSSFGDPTKRTLTQRDIAKMRMQLLKLLPLLTGGNFTQDEVRIMAIYISDCEDDAQCIDLIQLLVSLAGYRNKSVLAALLKIGPAVWLPLLTRTNATLRSWALKLVCYVLQESAAVASLNTATSAVLAGVLQSLKLNPLKRTTFFSLLELFLGQITPNCKYINPIGFLKKIEVRYPLILPVIIDLVLVSPRPLQLAVLNDIEFLHSILGQSFLGLVSAKKWFVDLTALISQLRDEYDTREFTEERELCNDITEISATILGNVMAGTLLAATDATSGDIIELFAVLLRTRSRDTVALVCRKTLGALCGTEEDDKSTFNAAQASPHRVHTALVRWCSLAAASVFIWDGGAAPGMKPFDKLTVAPGAETRFAQGLLDFAVRLGRLEDPNRSIESESNEAKVSGDGNDGNTDSNRDLFAGEWEAFVGTVLMRLSFLVLCETDSLVQVHRLEDKRDEIGRLDALTTRCVNALATGPTTRSTTSLAAYLSGRLGRWNEEAALATKAFSLCKTTFVNHVENTVRRLAPEAARAKTFYVLALLKDVIGVTDDPERQGAIKRVFYDIVTQTSGADEAFGSTTDPEAVFRDLETKTDHDLVAAERSAESELLSRLGAGILGLEDKLTEDIAGLEQNVCAGYEAVLAEGRSLVNMWKEMAVERKLCVPDPVALAERWREFVFNGWPAVVGHWRLDDFETSSRMRMRMRPNFSFDPHKGKCCQTSGRVAAVSDAGGPPATCTDEENSAVSSVEEKEENGSVEKSSETHNVIAKLAMAREGNSGSSRSHSACLIEPMTETPGNFIVAEKAVRFVPRKSGLHVLESAKSRPGVGEVHIRTCDIFQVYKRRYLLLDRALEIFTVDRASYMILFASEGARDQALTDIGTCDGIGNKAMLAPKNLVPTELIKKVQLTETWTARKISNFEYIMGLNTVSGRTYKDLSQYPVFPWVIADYTSETLDLSNPRTFRDLSKPMGALTPQRRTDAAARFSSHKHHIPNHWLNIDTVLHYMIRVEPFTTYALEYGGGEFDHPDRLFNSVGRAFANTTRELIPEFYCLPEMFVNTNRFDFGFKHNAPLDQSGLVEKGVGDVILPPWAKGSPYEFVRLNCEALESEYVSEHLQEWVDLIWGFKQSGEAAVSALNTYPEWMYPSQTPAEAGAEEFKKVYDGGQMPEQLFRKPHPKRVLRALIKKPLSRPYKDTVYPVVARECLPSEVVRIFATPKSLVLLCHDGFYTQCGIETSTKTGPSIAVKLDKAITQAQQQQQSPSHIELPTAGCGVRLASTVAYCPEANALVSGGVWDGTLRVRSPKANGVRKACAADGAVTCLAYDKGFLVAGTDGAAVAVYDLRGCSGGGGSNTLLKPHSSAQDPLGLPRHFLGGHMSSLSAVAVSEDLDLVVSASCGEEPVCLIHTLREGALLREIQTPEQVDMVMISRGSSNGNGGGVILLYSAGSGTLQALSVNCAQLATATLPPAANNAAVTKEGTPLPMAVSIDGRLLAVAPGVPAADRDAGPVLEVLTPHDLCSVKTVALSGPVEALEFTADSNFVVVSYADGPVVAVYVGHLTP